MVISESNTPRRNNRVRYELVEHIGVLNTKKSGWTREVNIVAWNGHEAKVDIREWDPQHVRMSRGVTLLEEEAEQLAKYLARRYGLIYTDERTERGCFDAGPVDQGYEGGASGYEKGITAGAAAESSTIQGDGYKAAAAESAEFGGTAPPVEEDDSMLVF